MHTHAHVCNNMGGIIDADWRTHAGHMHTRSLLRFALEIISERYGAETVAREAGIASYV